MLSSGCLVLKFLILGVLNLSFLSAEYYSVGGASKMTDVYGFGVFLLELVSGRNGAQLVALPKEGQSLQDWVSHGWRSG